MNNQRGTQKNFVEDRRAAVQPFQTIAGSENICEDTCERPRRNSGDDALTISPQESTKKCDFSLSEK